MGLKVNFSKDEAESAPREVLPTGEYHCKIVEIETRDVKPTSPNAGKPFWNVKFVVQSDKYAGQSIYSNIMLFEGKEGTLGSLSQFLKALGYEIIPGEFELPEEDSLIGRDINVKGVKLPAGYNAKAKRDLPERFNVNGYKPASVVTKAGDTQFLP